MCRWAGTNVAKELEKKLDELKRLITNIAEVPYAHEAFCMLRKCASAPKVTHLMRTLPPHQSKPFLLKFDRLVRTGFQRLLNHDLEDKWWRIAKLPVKFGGVGLRTGTTTAAAQFAVCIAKCGEDLCRILGESYDPGAVINSYAKDQLEEILGDAVSTDGLLDDLGKRKIDGDDLSLAQRCELADFNEALKELTVDERLHVKAHCGSDHQWLRQDPIT